MNYTSFNKTKEDRLQSLSEKTFSSLEDLKGELSNLWEEWTSVQSEAFRQLTKGVNVLFIGIVADSIPNNNAFLLLRILKLAPRKIVYRFNYDKAKEVLLNLFQNVETIDKGIKFKDGRIKSLEAEIEQFKENPDSSLPTAESDVIPISRLYRLASSYQLMMMHADDIKDEVTASAIRKDTKAALRRQGMEIVDYDGTNDRYFDVTEDDNCEGVVMTCPAIISKDGNTIIAKGNVFKNS